MSEAVPPEVLAFVAVGGNLGDPQVTVTQAIEDLSRLPHTRLIRTSSLYRTAPVDADGPNFVNAVIALGTRLEARDLLLELQQLENYQGRQRSYRNAPRTLDLDILLYGDAVIDSLDLQVPHPRMLQRAFVMVPLSEIAPERVTPDVLFNLADQHVERIGMPKVAERL